MSGANEKSHFENSIIAYFFKEWEKKLFVWEKELICCIFYFCTSKHVLYYTFPHFPKPHVILFFFEQWLAYRAPTLSKCNRWSVNLWKKREKRQWRTSLIGAKCCSGEFLKSEFLKCLKQRVRHWGTADLRSHSGAVRWIMRAKITWCHLAKHLRFERVE